MKKSNNYYITNKSKMMKEFNAMYKAAKKILPTYFEQATIEALYSESKEIFIGLFSQLPDIGGKKNGQLINLIVGGATTLSILQPLEKKGLSTEKIGKIIYDTFTQYFTTKPKFLRHIMGKLATSKMAAKQIKKQIEQSQLKQYPDDFVMEHIDTNENDFDFGYNYTECAVEKLFRKHNALQYLPYVCLGDYALFHAYGIGFKRTQTIGNGAPLCDFRFKKAGTSPTGWPPETTEEWKNKTNKK